MGEPGDAVQKSQERRAEGWRVGSGSGGARVAHSGCGMCELLIPNMLRKY